MITVRKTVFAVSAAVASLALAAGAALVAAFGFEAPRWLLAGLLSAFSLLVLLGGFTRLVAAAMPWLMLRPVRGAALVVAGVAAMYMPVQFIAAAVFLTLGIRLVMEEVREIGVPDISRRPVITVTEADILTDDGAIGIGRRETLPVSRNGGPP